MDYSVLSFFKGFSSQEVSSFMKLAIPVSYSADEVVLKEDDVSQLIMIIVSGQAKVYKKIDDANSKFITILEQGDIFGEMSFFDEMAHNANVSAHTDLSVMAISKKDFSDFVEKNPKIAIKILTRIIQICSQRVRNLNEELKQLGAWCISLRDNQKN